MNNLIYKIILFRPMFGRNSRLVTLRIFPTIFRQESNNAIAFTHQGAIDMVIDMEEWIIKFHTELPLQKLNYSDGCLKWQFKRHLRTQNYYYIYGDKKLDLFLKSLPIFLQTKGYFKTLSSYPPNKECKLVTRTIRTLIMDVIKPMI